MGHHSWHRVSTVATQTPAQGPSIDVSVPQNFPETVEMVRLASHEHVQQLVIEHVTFSVNDFIAPTPPVTFLTPSQQFPWPLSPLVSALTPPVLYACHVLLLLWKPLPLVSLVHFLSWMSLLRPSTGSCTPLKKLCMYRYFKSRNSLYDFP